MEEVQLNDEQTKILHACVAPLVWGKADGGAQYCNGTATFYKGGTTFIITNNHVFEILKQKISEEGGQTALGKIPFDLPARRIDSNAELDLATFHVTENELAQLGRVAAIQRPISPILPDVGSGIFTVGYPGEWRKNDAHSVEFSSFVRSGLKVKRLNNRLMVIDTTIDAEARHVAGTLKVYRPLRESGGISGSPILGLATGEKSPRPLLFGIVFEEPCGATPLEPNVLRARPVACINPDGTIRIP